MVYPNGQFAQHNESRFEDLRCFEEITDENMIDELLGEMIILNRYKSEEQFDYLFDRVVDVAAMCWSNRNENGKKLQHHLIKFKVDVDDVVVRVMPLNRLVQSLVFIKPIIQYIDQINIDDFMLTQALTKKRRGEIQDNIVNVLTSEGKTIREIQEIMACMSLNLKQIANEFSHADMVVFTAENLFLNHYRDSQVIRDINNTEYPPDMQTSEIVEENGKKYKVLRDEMIRRNNPFFMVNKYVPVLKPKQMEELYINFSQIPDGKNIVPVIMNGNGFKAGYHDVPVLYAGAIAARVPDIMNEEYMGTAGYFARNLMILTYGTISKTVYDCGSKNPIPITVDETVLDLMEGRFYYTHKGSGILKVLKKTDTHLIGQKLWFRSPCTCNLNEDCCHVCYGTVALKVGDLAGGFIYTTELLTSRISQNILSAKHLLKTNAEKVVFSDGFDKWFMVESSTVIPLDDKRFFIYLKEDFQDNISESLTMYVGKEKELQPLTISHYANLHIPDKVLESAKEVVIDDVTYLKISSFKVFETAGVFCNITPINIMMTQRYMKIMKLFETDIKKFDRVEDVVVTLMKLIHETIPILSTHGEIIISKLLRSVENKLLRPNFLEEDVQYQMLGLKTALQNIEAVTTALSFEQTRHHILHTIFDERNTINRVGPRSFADYLFGEDYL